MKNVFAILILATIIVSCGKKDQFKIKGEIVPKKEGMAYLYSFKNGEPVKADSAKLVESKFEFNGKVKLPEFYLIGLDGAGYVAQFFIEPSDINMTIYPDSSPSNKIVGSKSHEIFKTFIDEMLEYSEQNNKLREKYQQAQMSGNSDEVNKVILEAEAISSNQEVFAKNFIKEYKNSPVAPWIYLWQFSAKANGKQLDSIISVFDPSISESIYVKEIKKQAEKLKKTAVGSIAPDFSLQNPKGEVIKLSSYRGKYVLIDFWASWCAPCMSEMPNVVEQYNLYKAKGFEIVGVSLDRDSANWVSAIEGMQMNWIHGWDLRDGEGKVAEMYGVQGIPHTVLLDKEGKIIEKDLRGEKLASKLKELMN